MYNETDKEILSLITMDGKLVPSRTSESYLKKHGYLDYLLNRYSDNTTGTIAEAVYRLYNDIENAPICKNENCSNIIKFNLANKKFSSYCCPKCRNTAKEVIEKNKIGVSKSLKQVYKERGDEIKNKRTNALYKHYGERSNSPFGIKSVQDTAKQSLFEKYGVDNVMKLSEFHTCQKDSSRKLSIELWKSRGLDIEYDGDIVTIKNGCPIHGDISMSLSMFNNRTKPERITSSVLCPICNPEHLYSGQELKLKQFLDENNINYTENDRSVIPPLELDFYLPDYNLAIEMNGVYYHNEYNKDKNYHLNKTNKCKEKGIQLIHIWEDLWIEKNDIVLSMLRYKLGIIKRKIYARDCIIKTVDSVTAKDFLIHNHLQGSINSLYKFGLFYNDELVSIMTFGNMRICMGSESKPDILELYRFCNKINTIVIGGASKLFKYALSQFNHINTIISYAKRDWSDGNIYDILGFRQMGYTPPNYFYTNGKIKLGRYSCRKNIIAKNENEKCMTEESIMKSNGFYRCFDSGNIKYIYEYGKKF